ncbi:gamma carbonic anhydrase family protein [Clostridium oryzae]|uniref:2,3,4,5-tetrahydropyridine-2,6-dicarboxylate N-acetyltransferase n=1 Tax=Clostridium oryzae TaxID=1450648 RepID=A0A1V4I6I8_9CLOT|nr:gamma carbonic anhydrase family protein [Clostridium oryzae]OPJ55490.1 2,3,4,5-tetrahydropyridine-2,6-dicarboxylate N-acetyltransferase [Clostridium oryzae]
MLHKDKDKFPIVHKNSFIAEGTHIIGNVCIKERASVWYGAVLRGDDNYIELGEGSNIQDNCVVHGSTHADPVIIGKHVTIGHSAIIHGCKIGDNCLIGMGSIIMDGAVIGNNTVIGAGSIVTENKNIPDGVLCLGRPARVIRKLTVQDIDKIKEAAEHYSSIIKKENKE